MTPLIGYIIIGVVILLCLCMIDGMGEVIGFLFQALFSIGAIIVMVAVFLWAVRFLFGG